MSWDNKVIWGEGLFLQPQHFQQQDRYFDRLVRASTGPLRPFAWGLTELQLDKSLLGQGQFSVRAAAGILPDGTPFSISDHDDNPASLKLPEGTRNSIVYLILPSRQGGAVEAARPDINETVARYVTAEHEATDTTGGYQSTATLPIGKLRLRYALEGDAKSGYAVLGLARIVEVGTNGNVILDESYIPPVLRAQASSVLAGYINQIQGLLHHRADSLAILVTESKSRAASDFSDFLLLQLCNRYEPLLTHLHAIAFQLHPESFYATLVSLAGELSTFTGARRRPPVFPPYRHDDLHATFRPVMSEVIDLLSSIIKVTAVAIELTVRELGIRVGPIHDRSLTTGSTWVLAVRSQESTEKLRRELPSQIKIGPIESIRQLITVALRGIEIRALPTTPRQLHPRIDTVYFELDRSGPYWAALSRSAAIAIHINGNVPGLEMECWAIRG